MVSRNKNSDEILAETKTVTKTSNVNNNINNNRKQ